MNVQRWILVATVAFVIAFCVGAPYPQELVLQHIPTAIGLAVLFVSTYFVPITGTSFGCMVGFILLHTIGARWIYSYVPYDDWTEWLAGETLSARFGWERNHYDRLVHFASGLLGIAPCSELLQRFAAMRPLGAAMAAVAYVLAIGGLYEVLEWQIAIAFSPGQAEAYNGQQGDIWDPQKDLACAAFGALLSLGLFFRWRPLRVRT